MKNENHEKNEKHIFTIFLQYKNRSFSLKEMFLFCFKRVH